MEQVEADLCVVGAGSGGLTVSAGASLLGASVVLVERGKMGGDCLNYGCVPSKSLLAAARAAHSARTAHTLGVITNGVSVDFAAAHRHVRMVIDDIAPTDSEARYTGFGVRVIKATARFRDPRYLEAGEALIRARRFVIATGSAPVVPAIPGLAEAPYLTNETIFDLAECPRHLLVLGGGPAGLELAQAHRRLGAAVGVFELAGLLNREDPELVEPLRRQLRREGVALHEGRAVTRVSQAAGGVQLHIAGDAPAVHAGSHLLVAAGRSPNVADLNLAAAGVRSNATGIVVDAGLRSSNPRVLAVGDVAGQGQFTHAAAHHAEIVLRRALFRLPARVRKDAIPRVVYTDPEIAVVGLSEAEARARHRAVSVLRWPFAENDRARAEGDTGGFIKVLTSARGRILGAGIVGPHAGELIQPWALALAERLMIGRMARLIVPYPTLSEVSKRAAASFFAPRLFRPRTRQLVRLLARLG